MPYQPVINELGPRLIMGGYEGEANARMQGAKNVSDNIMTAAQAIGGSVSSANSMGGYGGGGSGIAGAVSKSVLTQQEIQQLGGKVEAMHGNSMISDDDVARFNAASLPKKRGMVGEWDASANILRQKDLDAFKTGNQMRQDSNYIGAQGANSAALMQLREGMLSSGPAPEPSRKQQVKDMLQNTIGWFDPATGQTQYYPGMTPVGVSKSSTPAAGSAAASTQFQEGQIVSQGGKRYRYTGGQFVPIQ